MIILLYSFFTEHKLLYIHYLDKKRKYKILMVPRRLYVCDMILEQEGVIGSLVIEDLNIDLVPLDDDILSLELPQLLNSFFMVLYSAYYICSINNPSGN